MLALEWWESPLIAPVIAGTCLFILIGVGRLTWKALSILQHVEPHFKEPQPGVLDNSLPARMSRMEEDMKVLREDMERKGGEHA